MSVLSPLFKTRQVESRNVDTLIEEAAISFSVRRGTMQSSVMSSTFSSSCCGSKSIKGVISSGSSVVGPTDGSASFCVLDGRQRRKLAGISINLKADRKSARPWSRSDGKNLVIVRAEGGPTSGGSLDEKLDELNSEGAVEGMQGFDRTARLMVDDLKPVEHPGTTSPKDLELQAEDKAFDADESMGGKEPVLEVASESAVDPDHVHENTVATSEELAPELGRSVEDLTTDLEDRAEKASERDAELLSTDKSSTGEEDQVSGESPKAAGSKSTSERDAELSSILRSTGSNSGSEWEGGVGQVVDVSKESGVTGEEDQVSGESKSADSESQSTGELTREEANEKLLEVAREGFEVLKWAAEGVVSAGANSRQGFEVAKELIDRRLKSFQEAADDTREVSAQLSEAALKKYEEIQESTAKFNEELNVQVVDKKAADDLKPESERTPISQLSQGLQATIDAATKEDSPLAKLGQNLQEAVSNLGKATENQSTKSVDDSSRETPVFDPALGKEGEGFFGDLPPAKGKSQEGGASSIVGQGKETASSSGEEEVQYEGFFGDIPVRRSSSSSAVDTPEELSSKSEDSESPAGTAGQRSEVSGDAYENVKRDYEDEVGNEQLKDGEKWSAGEKSSQFNASEEHDPAKIVPSAQDMDGMGIGPDE
ncbi:hypothetical protein R1sor_001851 [Riccia sorocarpa]|uniref:Uncharacterized protein n=1 Tax=Riccia sorocarpa TaxID=122646 RepID=A0ABD3H146_9MARC